MADRRLRRHAGDAGPAGAVGRTALLLPPGVPHPRCSPAGQRPPLPPGTIQCFLLASHHPFCVALTAPLPIFHRTLSGGAGLFHQPLPNPSIFPVASSPCFALLGSLTCKGISSFLMVAANMDDHWRRLHGSRNEGSCMVVQAMQIFVCNSKQVQLSLLSFQSMRIRM